ncbi:MAG: LamG domain-containing protein [Planctomycetota bacterium]
MTDPLFENTTLLLQADDAANGAQNNTFLDSSSNSFAITRNPASGPNAPTQGSFSPFSAQPGAWSSYYSGVADTNGTYFAANAAYSFGTGDFTVEAWINIPPISNTNGKMIVDSRPNATNGSYWLFALNNAGRLEGVTMTSGGVSIVSPNPVPTNQWVHVAYTRASGTLNLWVNGVSVASATGNTNNISSDTLWVGRNAFSGVASDTWFSGYMSNLRIVKGVAVYTGTFTPPASPLEKTQSAGINIAAITGSQTSLLFNQSNRFIDNSNINATPLTLNTWPTIQPFSPFAPQFQWTPSVIGGSGYFDGTGDYLTVPRSTAFEFGSDNFTMEFSIYGTTSVTSKTFLQYGQAAVTGWTQISWGFGTDASNFPFLEVSNGVNNPQFTITSNTALRLNEWNHLAVVRSGTDFRIYLNGVSVASTTSSFSLFVPGGTVFFWIARAHDNATPRDTSGYISNLRVVKGAAVYTGAFTPPRAPLATSGAASASAYSSTTNVNTSFAASATSLLCNFTNAGIYDGTMKNNLETVGNAQVSTAVVKYGSGSMFFDGTGDYLVGPASPNNNLNIGDFTLEFWVYRTNLTGDVDPIGCGNSSNTGYQVRIKGTTGFVQFLVVGGASLTTTTGITAATWQHIAIVRSGTTVRMYINGVDAGGSGTVGNSGTVTTELLVIGANRFDYSNTLNGYIDDLRITRGIARYTQNFIPPSVALPRQ